MRHADTTEIEWSTTENGETEFKRKEVGAAAGGDQLGCSLYEIPPASGRGLTTTTRPTRGAVRAGWRGDCTL